MPTPLRVLILEDSPTDAEVMVHHLREAGFAPEQRRVETEAEFLAHLEPTLDLVLIDYTLPDFNGRRALEILHDRGWDIPSIVVTGTISEETALESLRLGAADYLLKDRLARLGAAVRNALAHRSLQNARAAAEAAWQASEARVRFLADVLELSSQAFGVSYPDGRVGICNAALCTLLGYTEAELRALDWSLDLTPPEWQAGEAERLAELQRTGEPVRYEKECLRKDGSRLPVELLVHLAREAAESSTYYYAFVTDLTERKRAEAALRESEARCRSVFENSIDAILLTASDGRILAANPEASRIFGRSEEEICQAGLAGLIDPDSPRLPELLEERARTGKARGELLFIRKDGTTFPGEMSSAVFMDRDGIPKTSTIIRDIIERRRAEKALVRERDYSRTLVEGANAIVVGLDLEGRITLWNQAAERLTGYAWADLQGKDWFEVLVPRARYPQAWDEFRRLTQGELPGEFETPILTKAGEERIIAWRNSLLREGDTICGTISYGIDFTERKRAEEEIVERTRQLEEIRTVTAEITRELDLRTLLDLIARRATALLGAASGTVWLWDEAGQVLVPAVWPGLGEWRKDCRYHLGEGVAGTVAQRRTGLLVNDYRTSPHAHPVTLAHSHITAVVGEPLLYREQLVGVLAINNEGTERSFTEGERALLALFANQAAIAIENARLFQSVSDQQARVRALGGRLAETAEGERRRLALELHDQVGQSLTALGLNLNLLRAHLVDPGGAAFRTRLDDSLRLVEQIANRIQDVMAELRPPALDDYGLVAALRWYGSQFAPRSGIDTRVWGEEPSPRLSPSVEIALFRIVQEALTNVAKHAQATQVSVEFEAEEHQVRLIIADDGIGVQVSRAAEAGRQHWGLLGMGERAQAIGGRCQIASQPGGGTRIIVEVPR